MHRDVIGLVTLDFILRFILAGAVHMALAVNNPEMDPDNLAAHVPCFGIPGHVIVTANRFLMRWSPRLSA